MARGVYMTPERVQQAKELLAAYPDKTYREIGRLMQPQASASTVARVKRGGYDPKPEPDVEAVEEPQEHDAISDVLDEVHVIANRISQVTEFQHAQATKLNVMQDELASLLETCVDLLSMSVQVQGISSQMQLDSMRGGFVAKPDYLTKRRERVAHLVKEAVSYAG